MSPSQFHARNTLTYMHARAHTLSQFSTIGGEGQTRLKRVGGGEDGQVMFAKQNMFDRCGLRILVLYVRFCRLFN